MEIIKNYRDNKELRDSFNKLAEATFGLNFEGWYQNGYWGENYNPYSIVVDGKVVSNVSVNKTNMLINGEVKHFLQLGTVMTYEEYRNRGYIRMIMDEIISEFEGKVDGMYLFANDSVCEFYPKFGFVESKEYQYSRCMDQNHTNQMIKYIMDGTEAWKELERVMNQNVFHGQFDMVENNELIMFYVTQFMNEEVYYHKESDTFVIAEIEDGKAFVHNIFSSTLSDIDTILELFGKEVKYSSLGFAPLNPEKYEVEELKEDDCTFFIRGEEMQIVAEKKLRIPSLAHA